MTHVGLTQPVHSREDLTLNKLSFCHDTKSLTSVVSFAWQISFAFWRFPMWPKDGKMQIQWLFPLKRISLLILPLFTSPWAMILEWWAQPDTIILQLVCMPQVRPKGIENVYCYSVLVQTSFTSQMMFVFADGKQRRNVLQLLVGWSHALPLTRNSFQKNKSRIGWKLVFFCLLISHASFPSFISLKSAKTWPFLSLPPTCKVQVATVWAERERKTNLATWKKCFAKIFFSSLSSAPEKEQ